jgi:hypothetical protein
MILGVLMNITDLDRNLIEQCHAELERIADLSGDTMGCEHLSVQARKEDGL